MKLKGVVKGLFPINCFYNYAEMHDGRCRSKTCMLNGNLEIAKEIQVKGCRVFANHPEVLKMSEEKNNDKV